MWTSVLYLRRWSWHATRSASSFLSCLQKKSLLKEIKSPVLSSSRMNRYKHEFFWNARLKIQTLSHSVNSTILSLFSFHLYNISLDSSKQEFFKISPKLLITKANKKFIMISEFLWFTKHSFWKIVVKSSDSCRFVSLFPCLFPVGCIRFFVSCVISNRFLFPSSPPQTHFT